MKSKKQIPTNKVGYTKRHARVAKSVHRSNWQKTNNKIQRTHKKCKTKQRQSAFAQHILKERHQRGPITIMEMIEKAKKGSIMNIKEDFHIYHFNKLNKLIEEQKHIKESKNLRNMFDLIIQHQNTLTSTSQIQEV
jgi:predicted house-cleaning noncanonical NTP pyrophosphatase (MazG superfamily)